MGEYSIDGLMRFGMPPEIMARYAVALLDDRGRVLAGQPSVPQHRAALLPWSAAAAGTRGAGLARWATA